ESADGRPVDLNDGGELAEEVFMSVWNGGADNDRYNALAHAAAMRASQIAVLRAYGRYLQQTGIPQSQEMVAGVLCRYPDIARKLYDLFLALLEPARARTGAGEAEKI